MNVLLFLTDQQRAIQHFPPGWAQAQPARPDAPAAHGMTFEQRVHQRVHVLARPLDADVRLLPGPARREVHARDGHARAAVPAGRARRPTSRTSRRVIAAAGYTPVYKGKLHCNKPAERLDLGARGRQQYGFTRWNPPDAGANQEHPRGGRRQLRQRRPLHELGGHAGRRAPRARSST